MGTPSPLTTEDGGEAPHASPALAEHPTGGERVTHVLSALEQSISAIEHAHPSDTARRLEVLERMKQMLDGQSKLA